MSQSHPYLPNSAEQTRRKMFEVVGISDIEELYSDIPRTVRLKEPLKIPRQRSQIEVEKEIRELLGKNTSADEALSFIGGGVWNHYVPPAVDEIASRTEFLTSYTPYQVEISQGMLQTLFEYQSMICELTGMSVANASLYDWASSIAEAARMATRVTNRNLILVPKIIHPERLQTLKTYSEPAGIKVEQIGYIKETGQLDMADLKSKLSPQTSAIYIENPSYLGFILEDVEEISRLCKSNGSLFIVGVDPISLGILKPPGDYGADIVVGEGQPLGNHMNFGGPLLGIFACRDDMNLIRHMPGRLIGMTTTTDGAQRGFTMALQTREQHIRRERATSNICTNESLCAVAAAVYMALMGRQGFRDLATEIIYRSTYAQRKIGSITGVRSPLFASKHFKEFVANFDSTGLPASRILRTLRGSGIQAGIPISSDFPEFGESILICVTEKHSLKDIDRLASALEECARR
jgi:glycine dehydrogenase subunit 1